MKYYISSKSLFLKQPDTKGTDGLYFIEIHQCVMSDLN